MVTEHLRCDFCPWTRPGPIGQPEPWADHMAGAHPEYWAQRNAVVTALIGRGTYDTNYRQACGRLAQITLRALELTPPTPQASVTERPAMAVGDRLTYQTPPEPPPGSIVTDHWDWRWTREGSGMHGWTDCKVADPDETDNGHDLERSPRHRRRRTRGHPGRMGTNPDATRRAGSPPVVDSTTSSDR